MSNYAHRASRRHAIGAVVLSTVAAFTIAALPTISHAQVASGVPLNSAPVAHVENDLITSVPSALTGANVTTIIGADAFYANG